MKARLCLNQSFFGTGVREFAFDLRVIEFASNTMIRFNVVCPQRILFFYRHSGDISEPHDYFVMFVNPERNTVFAALVDLTIGF